MSAPELPEQVIDLLDRGLRVQAIKELRACERISLGEALGRIQIYPGESPDSTKPAPSRHVLGIAGMLDHPSCFMGGPSRASIRKAEKIVDYLREEGVEV